MTREQDEASTRLLFEAGHLKNLPRSGWLRLGIRQPESVAEHSHRTAVIALVLAAVEGADPLRASALALLHDMHETRTGDVPATGRGYVQVADPQRVTADQTAGAPAEVAALFAGLTAEFEAGETVAARVARDADKLDCLLAALEYRQQGYPTELWVASSLEALTTATGRRLADRAMEVGPASWWQHLTADG